MLGNIVDHRTNRNNADCDAVFEPTIHDDPNCGGPWTFEAVTAHSDYFHVTRLYDATVRQAFQHSETAWPFPVTIYLYDLGSRPIG